MTEPDASRGAREGAKQARRGREDRWRRKLTEVRRQLRVRADEEAPQPDAAAEPAPQRRRFRG